MSLAIVCPQCSKDFSLQEVFPGSRIQCPACNSSLVLSLQVQKAGRVPNVSRQAWLSTPDNDSLLQQQAVRHLSGWLDVPSPKLNAVLSELQENKAYAVWKIPKGSTGFFREITSPSDILKKVQRRILDRLLYRIPVSNAAHGFVPGRSIVSNAGYHLTTASAILNLDLKDAFPSVSATRVKHLYVRYLKIPLKHLGEDVPASVLDKAIDLLVSLTTYKESLPQGGPCSGCLLNIACITLDKNIYQLLRNHGESYRYTRYADDITISAPMPIAETLQAEIHKVVNNCGFQVNSRKSQYLDRTKGQMLEVTGLVLEKDKVRIPTAKLEIFRSMIHNAALLPTEQLTADKKLEIQSVVAFIKMVYDRLPQRIWGPYKNYMEKHSIKFPQQASKAYLDLYPKPNG